MSVFQIDKTKPSQVEWRDAGIPVAGDLHLWWFAGRAWDFAVVAASLLIFKVKPHETTHVLNCQETATA